MNASGDVRVSRGKHILEIRMHFADIALQIDSMLVVRNVYSRYITRSRTQVAACYL